MSNVLYLRPPGLSPSERNPIVGYVSETTGHLEPVGLSVEFGLIRARAKVQLGQAIAWLEKGQAKLREGIEGLSDIELKAKLSTELQSVERQLKLARAKSESL